MLYAFYCTDREDGGPIRAANREAHLAFLENLGERVFIAGPCVSEDGARMIGSLLVIECADMAAARALADSDPYAKAGLFASVDIRAWRKVFPKG